MFVLVCVLLVFMSAQPNQFRNHIPMTITALILAANIFTGCNHYAPEPMAQGETFPFLMGRTTGDGITYTVWMREDGSRYIQHDESGKQMDLQ
jgi:hypothetical protein